MVPFRDRINGVTTPVMVFANLWQSWDMFAPNPRDEDIWVDVLYSDTSGQNRQWVLTKMNDMGYLERWQKERWRKYFNDHLRTDAEKHLWQPFAEFTARKLKSEGVDVKSITFRRSWRNSVIPVSPALKPERRTDPWNQFNFYTWNAPSPETP
jgi:hypothetical protein